MMERCRLSRPAEPLERRLPSLRAYPPRAHLRNSSMDPAQTTPESLFEAKYLAFLETIRHLRPLLHRYCARMVGSVLDGEDVVQDALFQAYHRLDRFDDTRPLGPWLFRIAHNQCIDFLRRRRVRHDAEVRAVALEPASVRPTEPTGGGVGLALEHVVLVLPPKERACVLLKDVFDYSLEETAELIGSTVGGVKAALNRGRTKLATRPALANRAAQTCSKDAARLRDLYIDRFNRRDWDGVRALIAADARVVVADRFAGPIDEAPYFGRYERLTRPWRLAAAAVDGEHVLVVLEPDGDAWVAKAIVRLDLSDRHIVRIVDYTHCPWVLPAARLVRLGEGSAARVPSRGPRGA
jgi:RNA polymerase sigma-70 factor (ECF subfamily)